MRDFRKYLKYLVPGGGVEPPRGMASRDFKSLMSTSSITQAQGKSNPESLIDVLFKLVNSYVFYTLDYEILDFRLRISE